MTVVVLAEFFGLGVHCGDIAGNKGSQRPQHVILRQTVADDHERPEGTFVTVREITAVRGENYCANAVEGYPAPAERYRRLDAKDAPFWGM